MLTKFLWELLDLETDTSKNEGQRVITVRKVYNKTDHHGFKSLGEMYRPRWNLIRMMKRNYDKNQLAHI